MNKKVNVGKLRLDKLTVTKLSNLSFLKAGNAKELAPTLENCLTILNGCGTLTDVDQTQTLFQGPTRKK